MNTSTEVRNTATPIHLRDKESPTEQSPIMMEIDRLADAVTAVTGRLDLLLSRTAPVRDVRPQTADATSAGGAGCSLIGEAIVCQTRRLHDIANTLDFLMNTLEI